MFSRQGGGQRAIEIESPVGAFSGSRRMYATGGMLPVIPAMTVASALSAVPSPRMRSSEAIGSWYYTAKTPFSGAVDALGAVNLESESRKAAMRPTLISAAGESAGEDVRRWRGGPRYEPTPFEAMLMKSSPRAVA